MPKYETQDDLDNEKRVANLLAGAGYELYKLPVRYELDFAIHDRRDGGICGFAEVKARRARHDAYPTVMISLSKVLRAKQLTETTGLPSYLIFLYQDCLAKLNFAAPFSVQKGGRSDRGDPQDADVCAYYQQSDLTIIRSFETDVDVKE